MSDRVAQFGQPFPYTDRNIIDTDKGDATAIAENMNEQMDDDGKGGVSTIQTESGLTVPVKSIITKIPGVTSTFCLDVGGVLAKKNPTEDYQHLEPLDGCKEFLEELRRRKVDLVVNSAHPPEEVQEWLKRFDLLALINLGVSPDKPRAEKYLDDRMVRYKGNYDEALEKILSFEPWWHEGRYDVDSVSLDFDATLNTYGMPGTDDENFQEDYLHEPQKGLEDFLKQLKKRVDTLVIFTCRATKPGGATKVWNWLNQYDLAQYIFQVEGIKTKVKVYLDDRGMRFNGDYAKILDKLRLLQPEMEKSATKWQKILKQKKWSVSVNLFDSKGRNVGFADVEVDGNEARKISGTAYLESSDLENIKSNPSSGRYSGFVGRPDKAKMIVWTGREEKSNNINQGAAGLSGDILPPGNSTATPRVYGEPQDKAFQVGDKLHPKENLYANATSFTRGGAPISEAFAKKGETVTVIQVYANGAVVVQNSEGHTSWFAPGYFQEWGRQKGTTSQENFELLGTPVQGERKDIDDPIATPGPLPEADVEMINARGQAGEQKLPQSDYNPPPELPPEIDSLPLKPPMYANGFASVGDVGVEKWIRYKNTNVFVKCDTGVNSGKPGPCPGPKQPDKLEQGTSTQTTTTQSRTPAPEPSERAKVAKASHVLVDKTIQRYAEEHNEPRLAKALGGSSFPDSEPLDVGIPSPPKPTKDSIEMKTVVVGARGRIDMCGYAQVRKIVHEQESKTTFHTVVSYDVDVFNAHGEGQHDDSKRVYYYRRGVAGSATIEGMHKVTSEEELKKLISTPDNELPEAAKRTDKHLRTGKWKFFKDDKGKGYKNSKTGEVVRAKK